MASVMTPTTARILQELPQLSNLRLAKKWKGMLELEMKNDIPPPGTSLAPPNKSLTLFYFGLPSSAWEKFEKAVSEEERSEVEAVLAVGGILPGLGGDEKERHNFLVRFFMALLPSLPNLHRLRLGSKVPGDNMKEKEAALEAFYRALHDQQSTSSIRQLHLAEDSVYGTRNSCKHLADLLSNSCHLQTVEFNRVNTLCKEGVGHIVEALTSANTCLAKLVIQGCVCVKDSAMESVAALLLSSNCRLQELVLTKVGMGEGGLGHLCDALCKSKIALNTLDVSGNRIGGEAWARHLGNLLQRNRSVRKLNVSGCALQDTEGYLSQALEANRTLEELDISDNKLHKSGMESLFRCLANNRSKLKQLRMGKSGEMPAARELAAMISNGLSICHLDLSQDEFYSNDDWADHILPAMATNRVLQSLDMQGCKGLEGQRVRTALLKLLQKNIAIQHIDLTDTPLHWSGKAAAVEDMLRRNKEYGQLLSTMLPSTPTSCRIILCGREHARKSALLRTLERVYEQNRRSTNRYRRFKASGQRLLWRLFLPQSDYHREVSEGTELSEGTCGMNIHVLTDEQGGLWMSAWDFACQRENDALHHFMFPSGNQGAVTIFVYALNPFGIPDHSNEGNVKGLKEMKKEFSYWLKYVASNSMPDAPQPQVVVVITDRHRLARKLGKVVYKTWLADFQQAINTWAHDLRDVVSLRSDPPFVVNATDVNDPDIRKWMKYTEESCRTILQQLPEVPNVCNMVAKAVVTAEKKIVTTTDFSTSHALETDGECRAVAAYLNNAGEVMYHDQLHYIVQDPRWFGYGILGQLIDLFFTPGSAQGNNQRSFPQCGYLSKQQLLDFLTSVPGLDISFGEVDDLVRLMLLLNLCYEKRSEDSNGEEKVDYFLPPILYDARAAAADDSEPLKWRLAATPDSIFAGWRLESDDVKLTFLTDGFFSLLQVALLNYALQKNWCTDRNSDICILKRNLFAIKLDEIEVMVEYSSSRSSVDILVKSSMSREETIQFVQAHFIDTVRKVCASQQGCPGVSLSEAIIRPACCKKTKERPGPVMCAYRGPDQVISVSELKRKTRENSDYQHPWEAVWDEEGHILVGAGEDSGAFLLGGEGEAYPNDNMALGERRGLAVLISVEHDRQGSYTDRKDLEKLAEDLGFHVRLVVDKTAHEMKEIMIEVGTEADSRLGTDADLKSYVWAEDECFLCFVNAHGASVDKAHVICDERGNEEENWLRLLDDIVLPITRCKLLLSKPKVFFINTCRGECRLTVETGSSLSHHKIVPEKRKEAEEIHLLREELDSYLVFSTTGDTVSHRHQELGSYFVRALVKEFEDRRQPTNVQTRMVKVTHEMQKLRFQYNDSGDSFGQVPVCYGSLAKLLFL